MKYCCSWCGGLVNAGQMVNVGTALRPEWICKTCDDKKKHPGIPLGASMKKANEFVIAQKNETPE